MAKKNVSENNLERITEQSRLSQRDKRSKVMYEMRRKLNRRADIYEKLGKTERAKEIRELSDQFKIKNISQTVSSIKNPYGFKRAVDKKIDDMARNVNALINTTPLTAKNKRFFSMYKSMEKDIVRIAYHLGWWGGQDKTNKTLRGNIISHVEQYLGLPAGTGTLEDVVNLFSNPEELKIMLMELTGKDYLDGDYGDLSRMSVSSVI